MCRVFLYLCCRKQAGTVLLAQAVYHANIKRLED